MSSLVIELRRDLEDAIKSIIDYLKEIKSFFEPVGRRNENYLDEVYSRTMQKLTNDLDELKDLLSGSRISSRVYMTVLNSVSSIPAVKSYIDSKDTNIIIYYNSAYDKATKAEEKILEATRLVELI